MDLNLLEVILGQAELTPADLVLEVGTGTGSLTARLADLAGAVLSVEIDPHFFQLATETLGFRPHVRLIPGDILKNKNLLNPDVMASIHAALEKAPFHHVKLVANLPYAVATPVISNLLLSDITFERMVVTVQWEIAEKLLSQPNTKEFGALAVLMQALADVELVRRLPPEAFWPKPKVESAVVCIRPRAEKRASIGDVLSLRNFLRDVYSHRRKNLRSGLAAIPGASGDKSQIDEMLAKLDIDGRARAETLTVEQHLHLWRAFCGVS